MNYNILGTGSSGNCIIVNDSIMLDCGLTYKKIKSYLKNIKLIFISHSHQDHLLPTTIKQIAYNYPTIKFVYNIEDLQITNILVSNGILAKNCYGILQDEWFDLGICKIKLEELYHDVLNSACHLDINGKKLLYVTDTSRVEHINAKNYDTYLIENNYNEDILQKHLETANDNERFYLSRTMNTHLSKGACDEFLMKNMCDNSKFEYIHLSKYNNTENGDYIIKKGENHEGNMETNR